MTGKEFIDLCVEAVKIGILSNDDNDAGDDALNK